MIFDLYITDMFNWHEAVIIQQHICVCGIFNISAALNDPCLPQFRAIPKPHKVLYYFGFITCATHCTIRQLSFYLHDVLKHIRKYLFKYCSAIKRKHNCKHSLSIKNSYSAIDPIFTLQRRITLQQIIL